MKKNHLIMRICTTIKEKLLRTKRWVPLLLSKRDWYKKTCQRQGDRIQVRDIWLRNVLYNVHQGAGGGRRVRKALSVILTSQCLYNFRPARALITSQYHSTDKWRKFPNPLHPTIHPVFVSSLGGTSSSQILLYCDKVEWMYY